MKLGERQCQLDAIDLQILAQLQQYCRISLAKLGEQVGLSAPSVLERVKKLEEGGVITGYHAHLAARLLGKDVTAFIGVSISHPTLVEKFARDVVLLDDVLECHHVTGQHSMLLKVKTDTTATLEKLITAIRSLEGVARTETMVVLSTRLESTSLSLMTSVVPETTHAHKGRSRVELPRSEFSEGNGPKHA
jgi:Lrp/AsnC family leucine-responsive transcriptional regulator